MILKRSQISLQIWDTSWCLYIHSLSLLKLFFMLFSLFDSCAIFFFSSTPISQDSKDWPSPRVSLLHLSLSIYSLSIYSFLFTIFLFLFLRLFSEVLKQFHKRSQKTNQLYLFPFRQCRLETPAIFYALFLLFQVLFFHFLHFLLLKFYHCFSKAERHLSPLQNRATSWSERDFSYNSPYIYPEFLPFQLFCCLF